MPKSSPTFNAGILREALSKRYPAPGYTTMFEVRDATGFDATRSADALVLGMYKSRGMLLQGFEFKVSRSDWLCELKDPRKAETWMRYCHHWWLLTQDPGIVHPGELPPTWGLLKLGARNKIECVVQAPMLEPEPLTMKALTAIVYNSQEVIRASQASSIAKAQEEGFDRGKKHLEWELKHEKERHSLLTSSVDALETACGTRVVRGGYDFRGRTPEQVASVFKLFTNIEKSQQDIQFTVSGMLHKAEALEQAATTLRTAHAGLSTLFQEADDVSS